MKESNFDKIYKEHLKILKNKEVKNNKIIVFFSAIPACGKTTIAKILEDKYKAIRFSHDDIRKIIKKLKIKSEKPSLDPTQDILKKYDKLFFDNYLIKNNFIILDASIDRDYKEWFIVSNRLGLTPFVIRIEMSQETFMCRIQTARNPENWAIHYARWKNDFDNCKKVIKAEVILDADKEINMNVIYSKLDKIIK